MNSYCRQFGLYLWHKGQHWLQTALTHPRAGQLARTLQMQKPYRVDIGHPDRVVILLVGCGGTGSHTAPILAQLGCWAKTNGIDMRLYFVDHDHVAEHNLVRQNFCPAEIGYPKAFTLAWRYTAAFGLQITPVVERFSAELLERYRPIYSPQGTLTIVIGAVDNVCARRDIAEAIENRLKTQHPRDKLFWLDSGNERLHGQILLGNSLEPEPLLSPLGFCIGLPLPHIQEPTLLLEREPSVAEANLSCAELTLLGEQSAMINRAMATFMGVYLYRLLQSRDLTLMNSYISLQSGSTRSTPITGGRVVRPVRTETPLHPPVDDDPDESICPECGGDLIEGQDEWQGVLIGVRFCTQCTYRQVECPECGGEITEVATDLTGDGRPVPVLNCLECEWHQAIPGEEGG